MKSAKNKDEFFEVKPEQSGLPFSIFIQTPESRRKKADKNVKKRRSTSKKLKSI